MLGLSHLLFAQVIPTPPPRAPLFTAAEIDGFVTEIKQQKKIPDRAIDHLFSFYRLNRASTGGLQDSSCLNQKGYKIRSQDPQMSASDLPRGIVNEECLCVMDYTRPKTAKRGHCLFLKSGATPTMESFVVAHGSGSQEKDGRPVTFTNSLRTTGTTLSGLHLTAKDTYNFRGRAKAVGAYTSTGLSLYGVESINWTASAVGKATHGAPYVIDNGKTLNVGRSHGCPAMTVETAKVILPRCRNQAAWLNYTDDLARREPLGFQSCPKGGP